MNEVDLTGYDYKVNPYPLYHRLCAAGPVHRVRFPSGVRAWLVTGYEAALSTLTDPRLGKNHDLGNAAWRARAAIMPEPQHSRLQAHLLHQDAPAHTRMRAPVTAAFSPKRVLALEPRIEQLTHELIDAMPEGGADLFTGLTAVLPFRVLAEAIGLDPGLARDFRREWGAVVAPVGPGDPRRPVYEGLLRDLEEYIARVVAHARRSRPAGLVGELVAMADTGRLTADQLTSTVFQLLVAGQEPVTNQLNLVLLTLLREPGLWRRLKAEPALIGPAVEELLRHDGAFELTTWRFLPEDGDLLGTTVPAGDSVIVSLCAAGRDARRFPDPDRIDLDRASGKHLAFGHGAHYCPGAGLARAQLRIVVTALLDRLVEPALAVPPEQLTWVTGVLARGVKALPVTYQEKH